MFPPSIQNLIELLSKIPSIGPRQAARISLHLAKKPVDFLDKLSDSIKNIKLKANQCGVCYAMADSSEKNICQICANPQRDQTKLAVFEKDLDMINFEKSKIFNGHYHILGGVVSPLNGDVIENLKIKELFFRIKNNGEIKEIILATNPTTEGDSTALYIEKILSPLKIKITRLGRGVSKGSELEYADEETIFNAFVNRK